jgi:AraC-like DNA-binding protein
MALASKDLELPISEHNQELHELATLHLDRDLLGSHAPMTAQVRHVVETLLGTGSCTHREVAKALYMHPRGMQRRLEDEDTTFEVVKDHARRDLARSYISQPGVPLSRVAALLDYSYQSALGRSCQRWFSTSPGALRRRLNIAS